MVLSKVAATAIVALLLTGLAACSVPMGPAGQHSAPVSAPAPDAPASQPGSPRAGGPTRLALLVPEGAESRSAARLASALILAARMAAEAPGAPPLELRVYDTAGQPEIAETAAARAIADGADILLGPLFTASTEAVARAAAPARLPVLAFSNDSAVAGGPVWITGYTPEAEARRVLEYARSQGLRRPAVLHPDTAYGQKAATAARRVTGGALGPAMAYERSFKGIEAASRSFAEAVRAEAADAVLLPAGGDELKAVASFLNFHALDPGVLRYLGTAKWNARATLEEPALRGGWFASPDPDRAGDFAARYAALTGESPPALAHLGFDAVRIAAEIALTARGDANAALRRARVFDGALGPVRFGPDQVAERALAVLEVGPGQFVLRDPAPVSPAAGS